MAPWLRYPEDEQSWITKLRYPDLGTLTTSNPGLPSLAPWLRHPDDKQSWITRLRHPGCGTLTTENPEIHASAPWLRHPDDGMRMKAKRKKAAQVMMRWRMKKRRKNPLRRMK